MSTPQRSGLVLALAWLIFPAVPVVLEGTYHGLIAGGRQDDPQEWDWLRWLIELGPLIGLGFLAGATAGIPDELPAQRGLRGWPSRRAIWVAVGPWMGFLVWAAIYWALAIFDSVFSTSILQHSVLHGPVLGWVMIVVVVATLCYGWLLPAWAAVRRARRLRRARDAIKTGVAVAAAFIGSLFGSVWAITEWWRSFFFDSRVWPALLVAASVGLFSGCAAPTTYGQVRRRELFEAMLPAWTFGLALLWLWWGRPRREPSG
jgi:hypothetical protein